MGDPQAIVRLERHRRVYLVDRHALMRRAAAEWINHCEALAVCGMAGGTAKAFKEINRLHPDVVVTEIMRPTDLDFIEHLHRAHPHLPILVFTIQEEALHRQRAEAAGASGYLMKETGGDQLVRAIQTVLGEQGGGGPQSQPCQLQDYEGTKDRVPGR